jgi:hypothetical protein
MSPDAKRWVSLILMVLVMVGLKTFLRRYGRRRN